MSTSGPGKVWVGRTEACEMLGVSKTRLARLAEDGVIRSTEHLGPRKYLAEDLERVQADREDEGDLVTYGEDGSESINLNGRVPDWIGDTFVGRADACWMYLTAHGYLDRDESDRVRGRLVADVERSGQQRRFRCCAAPAMGDR